MSKWVICSKKWAICSFTHFWWATWAIRSWSLIFGEQPERIAHGRSFLVSDLSDRSHCPPKMREWANGSFFKIKKPYIKHTKNKILDFLPKIFERIAHSLTYHERPERIAHGCSFVMSDLSDSLTVALLIWVTWVIPSQSLICLQRSEQIAHSRSFRLSKMSKWANERWANKQWTANEQIPSSDLQKKSLLIPDEKIFF